MKRWVLMLDRRLIREDVETLEWAIDVKGVDDVDLDRIREIDVEWRELKATGDDLRRQRNETSRAIGELKQRREHDAAESMIEKSAELKDELEDVEARAEALEEELDERMLGLPMIPADDVPVGEDESDNVEVRRWGFEALRELPDPVVPHYELGEELDVIDERRAAKTTGSGFYFLKGDGARLEHALVQFMLDVHREQDYVDVLPPVMVDSAAMTGTGQLPKFAEDAYRVADEDKWLIPTAEVPVTNLFADEILFREELPLKYQAFSPNFRREAGEHGTETRGIVRVHQFHKVELVNFVEPEDSYDRLEALVEEAAAVLERLGLPYRVLEMCTGDMGFAQAKKYDLEVWAPADDMPDGPAAGGRWLEVSSASNFEEFQARRAGIRYRPEHHESADYLHTLNASGTALPRVMVALLEYYQNSDGTVTVPEALRPYLGGQELIEGHEPVGETAVGDQ